MVAKFVNGHADTRIVHAADAQWSSAAERTLCGLQLEDNHAGGTLLPTETPISCPRCASIIRICRSIRADEIEKDVR